MEAVTCRCAGVTGGCRSRWPRRSASRETCDSPGDTSRREGPFVALGEDDKAPGLQVAPARRLLSGSQTRFKDLALDGSGKIQPLPDGPGGGEHLVH